MYSALTYGVMKSYLTCVWDKRIRSGYITLETKVGLCDNIWYGICLRSRQNFISRLKKYQPSFAKQVASCFCKKYPQFALAKPCRYFMLYINFLHLSGSLCRARIAPSIAAVQELRTGHWFDPRIGPIFYPRIDDCHYDMIHSSLTVVYWFDNGYVGKHNKSINTIWIIVPLTDLLSLTELNK